MSTTAAPAPTQVPVGSGLADRGAARTHRGDGSFARGAERGEARPSGFRSAVVLAVLLTVPAVYLVGKGELSAHDALVRFGCAWAFATSGVALVLATVGGSSVPEAAASSLTAEDRGDRVDEEPEL